MKVLVVGGGGREHALAWKLRQSTKLSELYVAPGNAGTARLGTNLPIDANDLPGLAGAAKANSIDLTVVGPEGPLAEGIVDLFQAQGMAVVGPTKAAARIESSKSFARDLMQSAGIPCARGASFESFDEASAYLMKADQAVVVKADGLAAGKGVVVAEDREEAKKALSSMMRDRLFGKAGDRVIIEERLVGREVSLLAFSDGDTVLPMVPACDHKRVFDWDRGPNTGGMGCFSPPRFFGSEMTRHVVKSVLEPAIRGLASRGTPYQGILYAGLMVTSEGPKVLEFNARFGDPETQAILPRLKTDLLEVLLAISKKNLRAVALSWRSEPCVGVVMASKGYPGNYEKGFPIFGLDKMDPDVMVFHSGTRLARDKGVVTDGGRVLTVAALGRTMAESRDRAYANVQRVSFAGCHYRKDIAASEVR
ncbi:MAG: phosphoribosylamine--glycine ligase [Chloroflexi bacterium]|nr:phosphoribosylamine--glycine ligase [Chloroflexota bacterium]